MAAKRIDIAIIGGGMGGLCAAIGCIKHSNLNVQIYEAAHHFGEIGAGVAIGPNAQRALKLIGDEVHQAYLSQETNNQSKEFANTWFEYHMGMGEREGELLAAPKNESGQSTVHRAKFLEEFVKLVPPGVAHFGKRLVSLEEAQGGRVTLRFQDESTAEADCVIGADGIHSAIRRYILPEGDPAIEATFTGNVMYRGLIPMDQAVQELGETYAKNASIWCGYGGGVISFPIDHGKTLNIAATNGEYKEWHGPWIKKVDHETFANDFKGWGAHVQKIIKMLDKEDTQAWSVWDMKPASTYCKGKVCMMGDAAHASTPFQGQGAGQAIEDAYVLEALLSQAKEPEDTALIFKAYDRIRRPRSQRVVTTSREMGNIAFLRHPDVGDDAQKFKENVEWRMDWMWHRDIEGERKEAEIVFKKLKAGEIID